MIQEYKNGEYCLQEIEEPENIIKAVKGEKVGTFIHE